MQVACHKNGLTKYPVAARLSNRIIRLVGGEYRSSDVRAKAFLSVAGGYCDEFVKPPVLIESQL
jgi:hypothetical protein